MDRHAVLEQYAAVCALVEHWNLRAICNSTHKFAKTGRYASEKENGEDMGQISTALTVKCLRESRFPRISHPESVLVCLFISQRKEGETSGLNDIFRHSFL